MELQLPQIPITRNPLNGRILRGNIPTTKGKKWGEYNVPKESRKKILANFTNEGRKRGTQISVNTTSKKIIGIKNGKFFSDFASASEAARKLQSIGIKVYSQNIRNCCKGKRPSAGGIKWFYEKDFEKWQKEIA